VVLQHRFNAWQAWVFIEKEAKIRSPEGAQYESLGQRPRTGITKTRALKGRNKPKALYRPDGAYKINPSFS
jgi:hypothetical protein